MSTHATATGTPHAGATGSANISTPPPDLMWSVQTNLQYSSYGTRVLGPSEFAFALEQFQFATPNETMHTDIELNSNAESPERFLAFLRVLPPYIWEVAVQSLVRTKIERQLSQNTGMTPALVLHYAPLMQADMMRLEMTIGARVQFVFSDIVSFVAQRTYHHSRHLDLLFCSSSLYTEMHAKQGALQADLLAQQAANNHMLVSYHKQVAENNIMRAFADKFDSNVLALQVAQAALLQLSATSAETVVESGAAERDRPLQLQVAALEAALVEATAEIELAKHAALAARQQQIKHDEQLARTLQQETSLAAALLVANTDVERATGETEGVEKMLLETQTDLAAALCELSSVQDILDAGADSHAQPSTTNPARIRLLQTALSTAEVEAARLATEQTKDRARIAKMDQKLSAESHKAQQKLAAESKNAQMHANANTELQRKLAAASLAVAELKQKNAQLTAEMKISQIDELKIQQLLLTANQTVDTLTDQAAASQKRYNASLSQKADKLSELVSANETASLSIQELETQIATLSGPAPPEQTAPAASPAAAAAPQSDHETEIREEFTQAGIDSSLHRSVHMLQNAIAAGTLPVFRETTLSERFPELIAAFPDVTEYAIHALSKNALGQLLRACTAMVDNFASNPSKIIQHTGSIVDLIFQRDLKIDSSTADSSFKKGEWVACLLIASNPLLIDAMTYFANNYDAEGKNDMELSWTGCVNLCVTDQQVLPQNSEQLRAIGRVFREEFENQGDPMNVIKSLFCWIFADMPVLAQRCERPGCNNEAQQNCPACHVLAYCSQACQDSDKDSHKNECYLIKVRMITRAGISKKIHFRHMLMMLLSGKCLSKLYPGAVDCMCPVCKSGKTDLPGPY